MERDARNLAQGFTHLVDKRGKAWFPVIEFAPHSAIRRSASTQQECYFWSALLRATSKDLLVWATLGEGSQCECKIVARARDNYCALFKVGASEICRITNIAKQQVGLTRKGLLQCGGHSRNLFGFLRAKFQYVDGPVYTGGGFNGSGGFFDHQMRV